MSDYAQVTSFTPKDSLTTGTSTKKVRGSELDAEFAALVAAIATKYDASNVSALFASAAFKAAVIALTGRPIASFTFTAGHQVPFNATGIISGGIGSGASGGAISATGHDMYDFDGSPAFGFQFTIYGLDVNQNYFTSLTVNGVTYATANAYSYTSGGGATTWVWSGRSGMVNGSPYTATFR